MKVDLFLMTKILGKVKNKIIFLFREILTLGFIKKRVNQYIYKTGVFQNRYIPEDYGYSILFTNNEELFVEYSFRRQITENNENIKVSLISTVFNEINNVHQWIEAINNQARLPDEIVVVDAGSNDGTYEQLMIFSKSSKVPFKIIRKEKINIAQGRNIAIEEAEHEIIAATDFGCRPKVDWLENLVAPFEIDIDIEMVAGWYIAQDLEGNSVKRRAWPTLDQVDPNSFIPSSRSIAFTKSLWEKVGGYPEWLTLTGEDTYFALELRKVSKKRAFVPDAVVVWFAPNDWKSYWKKIYLWSVGDGESGLNGTNYWNIGKWILAGIIISFVGLFLFLLLIITKIIPISYSLLGLFLWFIFGFFILSKKINLQINNLFLELGAASAQVFGFLKGLKRRKNVDIKRFEKSKGVFLILAGVPLNDTGGGSRGAQLARELIFRNYVVFYIHKFDSYESVDLGVHYSHPNLITYKLDKFSWNKFESNFYEILKIKTIGCIIEFPLADFLQLINELKQQDTIIFYDLLDAWDTQLGSTWYKKDVEKIIIDKSDFLIATAPILKTYLRNLTSKQVTLLPNAVNHRLFNFNKEYLLPLDLPKRDFTLSYIGALWGDWFDWNLLIKIAKKFPESSVVIIGDYRGQCSETLPNLHFLGLKPQGVIPPYLKYTDVAIIPWKVNKITIATSPLKLYEYLAMHVPTVVPNLPLLQNIPYVYTSHDDIDFVENIKLALSTGRSQDGFENFVSVNSWEHRVKEILDLMEN